MIPDFADERVNKKLALMLSNEVGKAEYIIASGIRIVIWVFGSMIELIFCDIKGRFAKIHYEIDETRYWLIDRYHHNLVSQSRLIEYLMSLSPDLAEWLLWNRLFR